MAEAGFARAGETNVVDDRVLLVFVWPFRRVIEIERVADAPGDVVIGAGRVAADAEAADEARIIVKREAAAERHDAADAPAENGIGWRAEFFDAAFVDRIVRRIGAADA